MLYDMWGNPPTYGAQPDATGLGPLEGADPFGVPPPPEDAFSSPGVQDYDMGMFDANPYLQNGLGMGQAGQEWGQYAQPDMMGMGGMGMEGQLPPIPPDYGPPEAFDPTMYAQQQQQADPMQVAEMAWQEADLPYRTDNKIMDLLLAPDPQLKYLAAAMFAEGFVNPEATLQWASQVQAQQQQAKQRAAIEMLQRKEQQTAKKAATDEARVGKTITRAREAGILFEVEQKLGKPNTEWTAIDAARGDVYISNRVAEIDREKKHLKEVERREDLINKARKDIFSGRMFSEDVYRKFAVDPETGEPDQALLDEFNELKTVRELAYKLDQDLKKSQLEVSRNVAIKLSDDTKAQIASLDNSIAVLNNLIKTEREPLTDWDAYMKWKLSPEGKSMTIAEKDEYVRQLNEQRNDAIRRRNRLAGAKDVDEGTLPIKPFDSTPKPTASQRQAYLDYVKEHPNEAASLAQQWRQRFNIEPPTE